ncbi:metal ABC transporter ATP-binding protein [Hoyosella rhizosphaerae]|uniref:metal ABC transporter ATP-binding protein n=1 Tax=Hoyosella rhizosphaerae TaxID=1755582 RepID=UPI0016673858|nr:metal ABC transporter ATP-binding protein [Hoyosella rhizosphaerae]MBN4928369.1 metal ABC transporter ATP-binding protein [Hoyosella rhizosphaerae]
MSTSPSAQPDRPGASPLSLTDPVVELRDARLAFGHRKLWDELTLKIHPGEFVAVLGPNGSGKTTLLRVLLGLQNVNAGHVRTFGDRTRRGDSRIGYIPQQKTLDRGLTLRGRDLVGLGFNGHHWGLTVSPRRRRMRQDRVNEALNAVGAQDYADAPVGRLSGGEQQRLRVAQSLVSDPGLLLCDEPLLSLDLASQRKVAELIDSRRHLAQTAVIFVTHEINPILNMVDKVLYLVDGRFRIGPPNEVMTSQVLSELYRTDVEVLKVRNRLVVVGTGDSIDVLGRAGQEHHLE